MSGLLFLSIFFFSHSLLAIFLTAKVIQLRTFPLGAKLLESLSFAAFFTMQPDKHVENLEEVLHSKIHVLAEDRTCDSSAYTVSRQRYNDSPQYKKSCVT